MICVQDAVLPHASVARYVLVNEKLLAHPWPVMTSPTWVTVTTPPQLSAVMTAPVLTAGTSFAQETVVLAGQVMVGGVTSLTVMTCVQVAELPQASVARYVLVNVNRFAQV